MPDHSQRIRQGLTLLRQARDDDLKFEVLQGGVSGAYTYLVDLGAGPKVLKLISAPPARVYQALVDAEAVATWMVPDDMTSQVHEFNANEGGSFRISLTYDAPDAAGKTSGNTDTYHGRFVKLVPDKQVVQVMAFESPDPAMQGEMTATFTLVVGEGGTEVHALHENLPPGVPPEANELGWRLSLEKLAKFVEGKLGSKG